MYKVKNYGFTGIQTRSLWISCKWNYILDHCTSQPLNDCYAKIIILKAFFFAMNAVWSQWNCVYYALKDIFEEN